MNAVMCNEREQNATTQTPPGRRPVDILDPRGALVALGTLHTATRKGSLREVLAAWVAFAEDINRADLTNVLPPRAPMPILPGVKDRLAWQYLDDLVATVARNLDAEDVERHLQLAAGTMAQAAVNAAARLGVDVVSTLQSWDASGYQLPADAADWVDTDPVGDREIDLLVDVATSAAHYAHYALGDHRARNFTNAERKWHRARAVIDGVIHEALREAGLRRTAHDPYSNDDEDRVSVCEICSGVDGCNDTCPIGELSARLLIDRFTDVLESYTVAGGR